MLPGLPVHTLQKFVPNANSLICPLEGLNISIHFRISPHPYLNLDVSLFQFIHVACDAILIIHWHTCRPGLSYLSASRFYATHWLRLRWSITFGGLGQPLSRSTSSLWASNIEGTRIWGWIQNESNHQYTHQIYLKHLYVAASWPIHLRRWVLANRTNRSPYDVRYVHYQESDLQLTNCYH